MTHSALDYEDGMGHCPVGGCDWRVPEGREFLWPDHRDGYHGGDIT